MTQHRLIGISIGCGYCKENVAEQCVLRILYFRAIFLQTNHELRRRHFRLVVVPPLKRVKHEARKLQRRTLCKFVTCEISKGDADRFHHSLGRQYLFLFSLHLFGFVCVYRFAAHAAPGAAFPSCSCAAENARHLVDRIHRLNYYTMFRVFVVSCLGVRIFLI